MLDKLTTYFPIADMIAATFGPKCEVAIHDLSTPETSVIYVAGQATGRQIGQSFDHLVKNVLLSDEFKNDQVNNYIFTTSSGRTIKSSSALLRDGSEVIGAICINCDITAGQQYFQEMSAFFNIAEKSLVKEEIEPDSDVSSIIGDLINNIFENADTTQMTRKKAVDLVKFMDDKGIFLVKGAIDQVAARLGVSKVTIYSYLDEAKGKK